MAYIIKCVSPRVHPRIRGEYIPAHGLHGRFTPAYAGNTSFPSSPERRSGVHPRIRGEYAESCASWRFAAGSPPHTRGIPEHQHGVCGGDRFTPAYAGNTQIEVDAVRRAEVHPRIRGEYLKAGTARVLTAGSPPHTRGIPFPDLFLSLHGRFTPAYAGNTKRRSYGAACN